MKKYLIIASAFAIAACQQRMFGVDEATWNTLSEKEREQVIEGYNQRKEIALENERQQKEKELENERRRQEIEAQTAPFYAAADAISSICNKGENKVASTRIQEVVVKHLGRQTITIADTKFEVSPFSKMSDAWLKGQKVQVSKNDDELLYTVKILNLDNGETVNARQKRQS
ncbi:MAG: hypothetical protein K1X28_04455 [Parachlamydiales bacterium]|nr:hypothetical protein [Parachlamydiales bacterium]